MKEKMIEIINSVRSGYSQYEIFSDFTKMSALAISNTVDWCNSAKREKEYKDTIKKYLEEDRVKFSNLFAELSETFNSEGFSDILGSLYMELEISSKATGQFFTPYHISRLTAETVAQDIEERLKTEKVVTVNEPSVGGGAMIIALADVLHSKGINPQNRLKIICNDFDKKGVYMTYVQLSLLGLSAKVEHRNSLSRELFETFVTPMWVMNNFGV